MRTRTWTRQGYWRDRTSTNARHRHTKPGSNLTGVRGNYSGIQRSPTAAHSKPRQGVCQVAGITARGPPEERPCLPTGTSHPT